MSFLKKSRGSSLLEYTVLITVVIAGIVTASYYVPRAWNAYVKGESDGIQDSYNDPFTLNDSNIVLPGCNCSDWEATACESAGCSPTEMNYHINCNPDGCGPDIGVTVFDKCEEDALCCGPWSPGACGANPAAIDCDGDGTPDPCPDGFRQHTAPCGLGGVDCQCIDDPTCIFKCGNDAPTPHGTLCPLDNTNLPSNLAYTYVDEDGCSSPDGSNPKCQVECQLPYVPVGNSCACPPPEEIVVETTDIGGVITATATCPNNKKLINAKCEWIGAGAPGHLHINRTTPLGNGWTCAAQRTGGAGGGKLRATAFCISNCEYTPFCGDGIFDPAAGEKCDNLNIPTTPPNYNQQTHPGFPLGHHQKTFTQNQGDKYCKGYNVTQGTGNSGQPAPACANQICEDNCQTVGFQYPLYQIKGHDYDNEYFSAHTRYNLLPLGSPTKYNPEWQPIRVTCPTGKVFKFKRGYQYSGCEYGFSHTPWCYESGSPTASYQGECNQSCDMYCGGTYASNSSYMAFVCVDPSDCP